MDDTLYIIHFNPIQFKLYIINLFRCKVSLIKSLETMEVGTSKQSERWFAILH